MQDPGGGNEYGCSRCLRAGRAGGREDKGRVVGRGITPKAIV